MTVIYMMVGIPASGKTTLIKEIIKESKSFMSKEAMPYVSRDEVRLEVTGESKVHMEKEGQVLAAFCDKIAQYVRIGCPYVFADATHASPKSRWAFYNAMHLAIKNFDIPASEIDIIPLVIETPFEVCYERNSKRDESIAAPDKDMKEFYAKCQYPSKDEIGIDKLFPIRIFYNPEAKQFMSIDFRE